MSSCNGAASGANPVSSCNGAASGANPVSSWIGAASGANPVSSWHGAASGADSASFWHGAASEAPSVSSWHRAGSGADSASSWDGAGSGADSASSWDGADSASSWDGAGSGADSASSWDGAGSGADSASSLLGRSGLSLSRHVVRLWGLMVRCSLHHLVRALWCVRHHMSECGVVFFLPNTHSKRRASTQQSIVHEAPQTTIKHSSRKQKFIKHGFDVSIESEMKQVLEQKLVIQRYLISQLTELVNILLNRQASLAKM